MYIGYRVSFPGVKRLRRGVDNPPPSSAEVQEKIELHLYSHSGPSKPVLGRTSLILFFYRNNKITPRITLNYELGMMQNEETAVYLSWHSSGKPKTSSVRRVRNMVKTITTCVSNRTVKMKLIQSTLRRHIGQWRYSSTVS